MAVLSILFSIAAFIFSLVSRRKAATMAEQTRKTATMVLFFAPPLFAMIGFFAWIYIGFELWEQGDKYGWGWSFELISSAVQIGSFVMLNGPEN